MRLWIQEAEMNLFGSGSLSSRRYSHCSCLLLCVCIFLLPVRMMLLWFVQVSLCSLSSFQVSMMDRTVVWSKVLSGWHKEFMLSCWQGALNQKMILFATLESMDQHLEDLLAKPSSTCNKTFTLLMLGKGLTYGIVSILQKELEILARDKDYWAACFHSQGVKYGQWPSALDSGAQGPL